MKKILLLLLALGLVGAGIGYYLYNKPVESLEHKKPDVDVSADKLLSDYESDEKNANTLYLGKIVQVSGRIATIAQEEGKTKVNLETGNPISMVICELEEGKEAKNIKAGDDIVVKGLCSGYLSDVILVQSNVVK